MLIYIPFAVDARSAAPLTDAAAVKFSFASLFAYLTPLLGEHVAPPTRHFLPWLLVGAKNLIFADSHRRHQ